MKRGLAGYYIKLPSAGGESPMAFVPHPLPPFPAIAFTPELQELNDKAMLALGRLDGVAAALPDPNLFLFSYIRKEAVLSSQIEGTQSSFSDLLLFEVEGAEKTPDVQEVSAYVQAMNYGLDRMKSLPISIRLIKEIHSILLSKGRGNNQQPGEIRSSQNWIGGTRSGNASYVPPPPDYVLECLGSGENFIHNDPSQTPLLVKAALSHVQFETIHPFLDGNGRLGRLLITLLLCAEGALKTPLLYLSLYLKEHRKTYYDLLQAVRTTGDWEAWLEFFLRGVEATAREASETALALLHLASEDEKQIHVLGKGAATALRVHKLLQHSPMLSISSATKALNLTAPTIAGAFHNLFKVGLVHEVTGKKHGRVFAYTNYLNLLNQGTNHPW